MATREEPSSVSRYAASVPTGEPHTTHTSLSVASAASTRSWASLSLIGGKGPVIGQIRTPDRRVGEDRVDDLPAAPVADRVAAVVDGVGDVQVVGDPLVQLGLLGLGEGGQVQARLGGQVGEVRAGAAGDRVDDDPVGLRACGPGPTGRRCPGVRRARRRGSRRTAASPRPRPCRRRSACRCGRRPCGRRSRCGRP